MTCWVNNLKLKIIKCKAENSISLIFSMLSNCIMFAIASIVINILPFNHIYLSICSIANLVRLCVVFTSAKLYPTNYSKSGCTFLGWLGGSRTTSWFFQFFCLAAQAAEASPASIAFAIVFATKFFTYRYNFRVGQISQILN